MDKVKVKFSKLSIYFGLFLLVFSWLDSFKILFYLGIFFIIIGSIFYIKCNINKKYNEFIKSYHYIVNGKLIKIKKSKVYGNFYILVNYEIDGKIYEAKSGLFEYNPSPIINYFNVSDIPVYVLPNNPKKTYISDEFLIPYIQKNIENAQVLSRSDSDTEFDISKMKSNYFDICFFILGIGYFSNGIDDAIKCWIIGLVIYFYHVYKKKYFTKLKEEGIEIVGIINDIQLEHDSYRSFKKNRNYIIKLIYVRNNEIHYIGSQSMSIKEKSIIDVYFVSLIVKNKPICIPINISRQSSKFCFVNFKGDVILDLIIKNEDKNEKILN